MARPLLIAPSILPADFARLGEEVRAVDAAGADWIHVDVMDGHFVPKITIGPAVIKALRPHSNLPFDVHLMIAPVDPFLDAFAEAGADHISVHPGSGPHLHRTIQRIKALGKTAGVVLNPETPAKALDYVLEVIRTFLSSLRRRECISDLNPPARTVARHRPPHGWRSAEASASFQIA